MTLEQIRAPGPGMTLEQIRAKRGCLRELEPLFVAAYLDGVTFERMAGILAKKGVSVGQDTIRQVLRRRGYGGTDANANNIEFWDAKLSAVLDKIFEVDGQLQGGGV